MAKSVFLSASVILSAVTLASSLAGSSILESVHGNARTNMQVVQVGQGGFQFIGEKPEDLKKFGSQNDTPGRLAKQYGSLSNVPVEVKYPFIYGAHLKLANVFGKYADVWYLDWKLWLGATIWLGVWASWFKYGYEERFWVQSLFAFGINILILHHLQYALTVKLGMLVVCSMLCAQACFQSYMWSKSELSTDEARTAPEEFECETMYLDLALPIEQIGVLFIAQVCVSWFYMTYILANFDMEHVNYSFWMVAYLTMQMTMIFCRGADSALGKAFPSHDVFQLWNHSEKVTLQLQGCGENKSPRGKSFKISRSSIFFRGVTGFFCNAILREILAYTIPLMLMSFAEPMDFVVYCVGVNFICTIDDTKDRTYTIHHMTDDMEADKFDSPRV